MCKILLSLALFAASVNAGAVNQRLCSVNSVAGCNTHSMCAHLTNGQCEQHDGQCGYQCSCKAGWEGDKCDQKMACDTDLCNGQGTIEGNKVDGCTCACHHGWTGDRCDASVNDCAPNPCNNDGICTDGHNDYTCTCKANTSGDDCEVKAACDADFCNGNGKASGNKFDNNCQCTCDEGFGGDRCEVAADMEFVVVDEAANGVDGTGWSNTKVGTGYRHHTNTNMHGPWGNDVRSVERTFQIGSNTCGAQCTVSWVQYGEHTRDNEWDRVYVNGVEVGSERFYHSTRTQKAGMWTGACSNALKLRFTSDLDQHYNDEAWGFGGVKIVRHACGHLIANEASAWRGKNGAAASGNFGIHLGREAIGFNGCTGGGDLFSAYTFTGTKKVHFEFAGAEGGFMGYAQDYPGSHYWPIATQAYGTQRIRLHSDSQWRAYTDTVTCSYSQCRIMIEDYVGPCGNVYFRNFRIED